MLSADRFRRPVLLELVGDQGPQSGDRGELTHLRAPGQLPGGGIGGPRAVAGAAAVPAELAAHRGRGAPELPGDLARALPARHAARDLLALRQGQHPRTAPAWDRGKATPSRPGRAAPPSAGDQGRGRSRSMVRPGAIVATARPGPPRSGAPAIFVAASVPPALTWESMMLRRPVECTLSKGRVGPRAVYQPPSLRNEILHSRPQVARLYSRPLRGPDRGGDPLAHDLQGPRVSQITMGDQPGGSP